MALDEPTPDDLTEDLNGFVFCMTPDLAAQTGTITIDLTYMGFSVESEIPLAKPGGSSCGGSCSSGSCGM